MATPTFANFHFHPFPILSLHLPSEGTSSLDSHERTSSLGPSVLSWTCLDQPFTCPRRIAVFTQVHMFKCKSSVHMQFWQLDAANQAPHVKSLHPESGLFILRALGGIRFHGRTVR